MLYVAQASLKYTSPPVSASQMLELQGQTTTPGFTTTLAPLISHVQFPVPLPVYM